MNEQLTYFIITRRIFESQIWRSDPHLLKLFIYLIGVARHSREPQKYYNFEVKRGERVTSLSFIADENEYMKNGRLQKWSKSKVSRMLQDLSKQNFIAILSDTYGTHIKICNYDLYQDVNTYKQNKSELLLKRNCKVSEIVLQTNNNDKNDNNEKKIKYKSSFDFSEIVFPENLDNKDFKKSFKEWYDYLKNKRRPLVKASCEKQLDLLSKNSSNAVSIIEKSILNNWLGLFEIKQNYKQNGISKIGQSNQKREPSNFI